MTQERRGRIADLVRRRGAMRVGELAALFNISEVTIRSDLAKLERDGLLIRDHGGAIPPSRNQVTELLEVGKRATLHVDEKQRIGKAAAQFVNAGDVFIMDAGTTVVEMTRHLAKTASLTIVTNALNVALEAAAVTEARVILLGGGLAAPRSQRSGRWPSRAWAISSLTAFFLGRRL